MRFFIPTLLIIAALALFVLYTDPVYQNTKAFAAQNASYDEALTNATALHKLRDDLLAKRNAFADSDVTRLERILPDNVDNIRLIIDINNIALKNGLSVTNVSLGDILKSGDQNSQSAPASGPVGSVKVGFSVVAPYGSFLSFLGDLEHSLRLIDVDKIDYHPDANGGTGTYQVEVRTYWLH